MPGWYHGLGTRGFHHGIDNFLGASKLRFQIMVAKTARALFDLFGLLYPVLGGGLRSSLHAAHPFPVVLFALAHALHHATATHATHYHALGASQDTVPSFADCLLFVLFIKHIHHVAFSLDIHHLPYFSTLAHQF